MLPGDVNLLEEIFDEIKGTHIVHASQEMEEGLKKTGMKKKNPPKVKDLFKILFHDVLLLLEEESKKKSNNINGEGDSAREEGEKKKITTTLKEIDVATCILEFLLMLTNYDVEWGVEDEYNGIVS